MELTKEEKQAIINTNIRRIAQQIYDMEINAQVAKKIGNDTAKIEEEMKKLIMAMNEFEEMLKSLE